MISDFKEGNYPCSVCHRPDKAANDVPGMYALVTPKEYLISGAAIPKIENWQSPMSPADGGEDLSQFPADTEPKVPTLIEPYLNRLIYQGAYLGLQRTIKSHRFVIGVCGCVL